MWSGTPKLAFVALIVLNCILWSQSRYAHVGGGGTRSSALAPGFAKRGFSDVDQLSPFRVTGNEVSRAFAPPTAVYCKKPCSVCGAPRTLEGGDGKRAGGGFVPGAGW